MQNISEVKEELKEQKKQNKILQEKTEDFLLEKDLHELMDQLWEDLRENRGAVG